MQFYQLSQQIVARERELRLQAEHHRLIRIATPTARQRLARALRTLAARLEPVREAVIEPRQQASASGTMSSDGIGYALHDS